MTYEWEETTKRGENSGDLWNIYTGADTNEKFAIKQKDECDLLDWM